jgi:hypothetical protein
MTFFYHRIACSKQSGLTLKYNTFIVTQVPFSLNGKWGFFRSPTPSHISKGKKARYDIHQIDQKATQITMQTYIATSYGDNSFLVTRLAYKCA